MVELALIIELTGSRSRTVNRPLPENDPRQRARIFRARQNCWPGRRTLG